MGDAEAKHENKVRSPSGILRFALFINSAKLDIFI
jgi:hypothetical protein